MSRFETQRERWNLNLPIGIEIDKATKWKGDFIELEKFCNKCACVYMLNM